MEGVTSNTGFENQMAVSYSYGKVQNRAASEATVTYKRPKFVEKLDEKFKWDKNEVAQVDEITRVSEKNDYYNGTRNLKYLSSVCSKYNKLQNVCQKQENCGWCYSTNTCIHGTEEGPVDDCLPRHFIFRGKQI